jgi:hypothetical protein
MFMLLHYLQDHILSADMGGAVLQLAMNCSKPSTAAAAASRMPALLQPDVVRRLLVTAATRQHTAAVHHMVALPAMQQHLNAATLEAMLLQLLRHDGCINVLCQLPVAAELSTDAVTQLLLAAYQEGSFGAGPIFCDLDVSQQISSEQIEALLLGLTTQTKCYECSNSFLFRRAIHALPGFWQLNSSAVVRLLRTAISAQGANVSFKLCLVPAAANISSADVASLLLEAFAKPAEYRIDNITYNVARLPAVHQLTSAEVAQLLHAAAEHYTGGEGGPLDEYNGLTSLCELAAAQQLSREQVLQPLQLVVRYSRVCTKSLCKLPAVQQLGSESVAQLLQAAIAGGSDQSCKLLCALPAVQQLGSKAVGKLLQAALSADKFQCTTALWDLPAVQQLDSGAVTQLLQAAVAASSIEGITHILHLPGAVELSSELVASCRSMRRPMVFLRRCIRHKPMFTRHRYFWQGRDAL